MNSTVKGKAYGQLMLPTTLTFQRLMHGTREKVWSFLTESDLRRRWLASGDMEQKVGTAFTLVWRNDELTNPPGAKPESFGVEHSMESRITACSPPNSLAFTWGAGEVAITLEQKGSKVLLTLTHSQIRERPMRVMVGAGWHAHLDILANRVADEEPATPFWDLWVKLRQEYEKRTPA